MLIQIPAAEEARRRRLAENGEIPFFVPNHVAMARARVMALRMAAQELYRSDSGYREEIDRARKDTKPDFFVNRENPNRPVITVGAGVEWFEDMRDLSRRVAEKPDPAKDPKWKKRYNVHNDLDRRDEWIKDARAGRLSPSRPYGTMRFHISRKWEYEPTGRDT